MTPEIKKLRAWFVYESINAPKGVYYQCMMLLETGWAPFEAELSSSNIGSAAKIIWGARADRQAILKKMGIEIEALSIVPIDIFIECHPEIVALIEHPSHWQNLADEYLRISNEKEKP